MKDNDLNKAIYQLKQIGYEPQLRYNGGKASEFIMSLSHFIDEKKKKKYKEITYIITTQHLNIDDKKKTKKYNKKNIHHHYYTTLKHR